MSGNSQTGCGNAGCHGPSNSALTNIQVTGLPSVAVGYTAGATYTVTVNVVSAGKTRAGINLSVNTGLITSVGANLTQVTGTSIRHTTPKVMTSGATTFTFTWKAPNVANQALLVFASVNAANNNGNATGDVWATYSTSVPLTIDYMTFAAKAKANEIRLDWATSKEEDLDYFVVEKSEDGQKFDSIDVQNALGDPSTGRSYQFMDYPQYSSNYYYRIRVVSKDGSINYSAIQKVTFDNGAKFEALIFPNPVGAMDYLNINVFNNKAQNLNVELYDIRGVLVYKKVESVKLGTNYLTISQHLKAGQYIMHIADGAGKDNITKRIVVF